MSEHIPVLLEEVIEALKPRDGARYIDGTFGGGGYARAILEAAQCRVLGIDRDPDAIARGQAMVAKFEGRLTLMQGQFSEMAEFAGEEVDGVVLDLGVSSFQFDQAERGFSFRADGPLDMRMSKDGESAADFVNTAEESVIADVLWRYGEERQSRRIARAIVAHRPLTRTAGLAQVVSDALGPAAQRFAIHPATRTFQALRIQVNDELGELERGLDAATDVLADRGRLAIVSFHSLEDRMVKRYLAERSTSASRGSRHAPQGLGQGERRHGTALYRLLTTRPRNPSAVEIERNARARSAHLRAAERIRRSS